MDGLITHIGIGLGALFAVALCVAAWEHWRGPRPLREIAVPRRAIELDLDLDATPQVAPATDQHARQATLDQAYGSMVRGPTDAVSPSAGSWLETRPMVASQSAEPLIR